MAYTPSANKPGAGSTPSIPGSTPTSTSNFGNLRVDAMRTGLTGATANNFQTQDATGTPVTSPVTVNTTKTLTVPLNAYSCIFTSVTNAVQISEDSTQSAYFSLPAGVVQEFSCANQANIYLKTGGSTVVSFMFLTI